MKNECLKPYVKSLARMLLTLIALVALYGAIFWFYDLPISKLSGAVGLTYLGLSTGACWPQLMGYAPRDDRYDAEGAGDKPPHCPPTPEQCMAKAGVVLHCDRLIVVGGAATVRGEVTCARPENLRRNTPP